MGRLFDSGCPTQLNVSRKPQTTSFRRPGRWDARTISAGYFKKRSSRCTLSSLWTSELFTCSARLMPATATEETQYVHLHLQSHSFCRYPKLMAQAEEMKTGKLNFWLLCWLHLHRPVRRLHLPLILTNSFCQSQSQLLEKPYFSGNACRPSLLVCS